MGRSKAQADRFVFGAFLVLLFAFPLPLGANRPWLWPLFTAAIFAIAFVLALQVACGRLRPAHTLGTSRPALLAFSAWLGFGLLQLLPLPWATTPLRTISVEPGASAAVLLQSAALVALFVLTLQLVRTQFRLRMLLGTVVLAGLLQAAYGSLMTLSGLEYGVFDRKVHGLGLATGTFVNRNHFAGFIEICLALGLGALVAQLGREPASETLRGRARDLVKTLLGPKMRLRLALAVMVIALVLSRSRMGNTAFFASLLITGGLALALLRRPPRSLVILLVSLLAIDVLIIGTWFGVEQVVDRIQQTGQFDEASGRYRDEDRLDVDAESLRAWADYRWFGSGGGTFYAVFPNYRPHDVGSYFDHAHNDYLEFLLEFGILGVIPPAAILLMSGATALSAMRRRRDPLLRGTGFGAAMAIVAIGIHSTVDFNLRIPSNAAYFVIALALAWVASGMESDPACRQKRRSRKQCNQ